MGDSSEKNSLRSSETASEPPMEGRYGDSRDAPEIPEQAASNEKVPTEPLDELRDSAPHPAPGSTEELKKEKTVDDKQLLEELYRSYFTGQPDIYSALLTKDEIINIHDRLLLSGTPLSEIETLEHALFLTYAPDKNSDEPKIRYPNVWEKFKDRLSERTSKVVEGTGDARMRKRVDTFSLDPYRIKPLK